MRSLLSSWRSFLKDEDGTATIEFLYTFPVVITVFCAFLEASFFMIRAVSLDRSVDLVVRDLRIGTLGAVSHWDLKGEICSRGAVLGSLEDCRQALQIELTPIDTANFDMPTTPVVCRDRSVVIDPAVVPSEDEFSLGDSNQIMLMRVCLQSDPMFPSTVWTSNLGETTDDGGYSIIVNSTFVNEPRT
ncbi:MAG: hypothetical protein MUE52_01480 [Tabrizicola sp.]|jgi:hypothetical protein|nr:hypothetical protein [Tabrizicola sp.]